MAIEILSLLTLKMCPSLSSQRMNKSNFNAIKILQSVSMYVLKANHIKSVDLNAHFQIS